MNPLFITITFACLMAAAAVGLYAAFSGGQRAIDERLADLAVKVRLAEGNVADYAQDENFGRVLLQWAVRHLPSQKAEDPKAEKVSQLLIQAGYLKAAAPQIYRVVRLGTIVVGALLSFGVAIFLHEDSSTAIAIAAAGAGFGAFAPAYGINYMARKRQTAIAKELSDVLDLLVVCVDAGLGLFEAIKIVGSEAERYGQVIGRELSLVGSDVSSGASLGEALRKLAERTAVEDIRPLAATLIQSEQLGAQIAPALRASSDALRTRRRLRAEEAAQKTAVKILFPLVLFVLPAMLMVILGPAIIQVLLTLGGN